MDDFGRALFFIIFLIGVFVFGYIIGAGVTQGELLRCSKKNLSVHVCAEVNNWKFYGEQKK